MISVQIQNILKNSIEENGQATLLVCGGSSPLKIFKELSESDIDWNKVFISLVDDRIVDEDNPDSTFTPLPKDITPLGIELDPDTGVDLSNTSNDKK